MPKFIDRTGEKKMMNCGLEATIIRYGGSLDIDVQFEDGQVVYHRYYSSFQKGRIAPPIDPRYSHVGEKRMMNCGLEAEIIRYGSYNDIDVRFSNGEVTTKRNYGSFIKGKIAPPDYDRHKYNPNDSRRKNNRVGEKRIMNCGLVAEIIQYRKANDIDVRFEDGQIVFKKAYKEFSLGRIAPPNDPRKTSHLGEKRVMKCGLMAEIIRYGSSHDIDVRFENGQVVYNKQYSAFKRGQIGLPPKTHIGEKRMMNCGMIAEIICLRRKDDIDVQFEDGQITEHKHYSAFQSGMIAPPIMPKNKSRLGEKRMMNCGMIAQIIRYGKSNDIDLSFEDGQIVYHKAYGDFLNGKIAPPVDPRKTIHIGEKRVMNCGLIAEIVDYPGYDNISVRFEDGYEAHKRTYNEYKNGSIAHQSFDTRNKKTTEYGMFRIKFIHRNPDNNEPYFYCKCQKCGYEIIDTARNIIKMEHNCEDSV